MKLCNNSMKLKTSFGIPNEIIFLRRIGASFITTESGMFIIIATSWGESLSRFSRIGSKRRLSNTNSWTCWRLPSIRGKRNQNGPMDERWLDRVAVNQTLKFPSADGLDLWKCWAQDRNDAQGVITRSEQRFLPLYTMYTYCIQTVQTATKIVKT